MHLKYIENSNNSLHVTVTCRRCFIVLLVLFAPSFDLVSVCVCVCVCLCVCVCVCDSVSFSSPVTQLTHWLPLFPHV